MLTTGGLGPTGDDVTKTVVARLFGRRLVLDPELLAGLEARFQRLGRPMPALNRNQADDIESVYLMSGSQYSFLRSSGVKELATFGGHIDDLVPAPVAARLKEELAR